MGGDWWIVGGDWCITGYGVWGLGSGKNKKIIETTRLREKARRENRGQTSGARQSPFSREEERGRRTGYGVWGLGSGKNENIIYNTR